MRTSVKTNKRVIKKVFSDKIDLIKQLVNYQSKLTELYLNSIFVKERLRLKYEENIVVNNALLNQPTLSQSIMLLLENALYGSARVLLRQFFEYLIIAKFSEFDDKKIIQKWEHKTEENIEFNISLTNDVLNKIKTRKNISQLQKTWRRLSDLSHPTKYAQQIPPFLLTKNKENFSEWMRKDVYPNMHYTLDLFFTLLCMNYHLLISNWGKKAYRWYFGYPKDPFNSWKKEKNLKQKIKVIIDTYFKNNEKYSVNKDFKRTIFQYKQNWSNNYKQF